MPTQPCDTKTALAQVGQRPLGRSQARQALHTTCARTCRTGRAGFSYCCLAVAASKRSCILTLSLRPSTGSSGTLPPLTLPTALGVIEKMCSTTSLVSSMALARAV